MVVLQCHGRIGMASAGVIGWESIFGDGWKDGACVKDGIFCGGWQGLRIVRVQCCAGDWTVCLAFRLTR